MIRRALAGLLGLVLLAGCRDDLAPVRPAGLMPLGPLAPAAADPIEATLPSVFVAPELGPRELDAIEQVRTNAARLFAGETPPQVLDEVESVFFSANLQVELANHYRAAVQASPADATLRARLAWVYHWLGLTTGSLREARRAVELAPSDATAAFVLGFVLARTAGESRDQLLEGRDLMAQALELAPAFVGPGGYTAEFVQREIDQINGVMPVGR